MHCAVALWCAAAVLAARAPAVAGYTVDCNHEYADCDSELSKLANEDDESLPIQSSGLVYLDSGTTIIPSSLIPTRSTSKYTEITTTQADTTTDESTTEAIVPRQKGRLLNLSVDELQSFANALHNQSDKEDKKLLGDISDVNMEGDDDDELPRLMDSETRRKQLPEKFFTHYNPLLDVDKSEDVEVTCRHNNMEYKVGARIERGCDETCECISTGIFECTPRCKHPYIRRGRRLNDPLCFESPVDECCSIIACATGTGDMKVSQVPVCVYENTTYTVGSKWYLGCSQICVCEADFTVTCKSRCSPLPINEKCINVQDPHDECCEVQICDVSQDVHEEPIDNMTTSWTTLSDSMTTERLESRKKSTSRPLVLAEPIGSVKVLQNKTVKVNLIHPNNTQDPIHLLLSPDGGKTYEDIELQYSDLILNLEGGKDYVLKTKETGTKFNFTITATDVTPENHIEVKGEKLTISPQTISDKQILPQVSEKKLLAQKAEKQIQSVKSDKQILPEISERHKSEKQILQDISEKQTVEKQILPQKTEKQILPQMSEKQILPQTSEKQILPQMSEKQTSPQMSEKQILPQMSEKQILPQMSDKQILPQMSEKQILPQISENQNLPQMSEKHIQPQITEKQILPQIVEKQIQPQKTEKQILPEISDRLPLRIEQQIVPQIIGKQPQQDLSEKRILPESELDGRKGCVHDGTFYEIGDEFRIGCSQLCECVGHEKRECVALVCPNHVGLELMSKGCVKWAPSPPPIPPNCCPRAARCLSDGTCHYNGVPVPNWSDVPIALTGCERRCFCENGDLDCQEVCTPLPPLPPQTLRCPPHHHPAPVNITDDDCCKEWRCVPNGGPTPLPDFTDNPGHTPPPFLPTLPPNSENHYPTEDLDYEHENNIHQRPENPLVAGLPDLPPGIHMPAYGEDNKKLTVISIQADSPTSVKLLFGLPPVLVGLRGSVDLRYTDKGDEDVSHWYSQVFAPADEILTTPRLEFRLTGLKPSTVYKIRGKLYLHSLPVEPESGIYTIRTLDLPSIPTQEEKRREINCQLSVVDLNDTSAQVSWRHFTEDELQFIDGVQVRYRPVGTPIYSMTELLHHSRTSALLVDLHPGSRYEASLVLIPPPRAVTELIDPGKVEFNTAAYLDPYNWTVTIEARTVGSEAAELTWRGVPAPAERWVRVYRAAHTCGGARMEHDAFRLATRDVTPSLTLTQLQPGSRCRVWLELFLTNGKVKTSNVLEINTKSEDEPEPIDNIIEASSVNSRSRGDYYGALVAVGVVAALGALTSLLLLLVVVRRHRPRSVPITPVPSAPRASSLPPYDNPAYKLELQQETMDL